MVSPIYLDYQATTPLDPRAFEAMRPYLEHKFGNPHSATHRYGWEAEAGVEVAREQIAAAMAVMPEEIIFTSGATEANNLALKGVLNSRGEGVKSHLIIASTEHKCVLETARTLHHQGHRVTVLPVNEDGLLEVEAVAAAISQDTVLISIMTVNNEIGVIQPIEDIARLAKAKGVLFHTDAAQAFGKIPFYPDKTGVDLASLSAHKIYGPKGVGALYLKGGPRALKLLPHMDGGGQEGGIRSGTLSPALCAGFGVAAVCALEEMEHECQRAVRHCNRLCTGLRDEVSDMWINGSTNRRLYSNLNISFPGIDGERLLADLRGVALSSGAACASALTGPSYVLEALGLPKQLAQASLRLGTGRFTTDEDIENAIKMIAQAVKAQKEKKKIW